MNQERKKKLVALLLKMLIAALTALTGAAAVQAIGRASLADKQPQSMPSSMMNEAQKLSLIHI